VGQHSDKGGDTRELSMGSTACIVTDFDVIPRASILMIWLVIGISRELTREHHSRWRVVCHHHGYVGCVDDWTCHAVAASTSRDVVAIVDDRRIIPAAIKCKAAIEAGMDEHASAAGLFETQPDDRT